MRISEISLKLGVPRHYLDYWKKIGLVGHLDQDLDFQDLVKIRFILQCRKQNISLQKIRHAISEFGENTKDWQGRLILLGSSGELLVKEDEKLLDWDTGQFYFRELGSLSNGKLVAPEKSFWNDQKKDLHDMEKEYMAALEKGSEEEIRDSLAKILSAHPNHTGALIESGNAAFEAERYDDAVFFYEKALEQKSDCVEAIYNIANIYFKQKKFAAAIRYFHRCIDHDPDFPESYYNLGVVYYSLHYFEKAEMLFNLYLNLDGDSTWADQARQFIEEIRSAGLSRERPALFEVKNEKDE